ncbi:acyltransferase-domain-containing protein [Lipomyces arxii]|uniref:acyltransferase-domain-containing protein n=1 Tax=Lipomyces arxii TaxID=56418 RepID=UPI0034CF3E43
MMPAPVQQPSFEVEMASLATSTTSTSSASDAFTESTATSLSSLATSPTMKRAVTSTHLKQKKPVVLQAVRFVTFVVYFSTAVLTINFTQLVGLPIRLFSKTWFHAYVDYTKQSFGLVLTTMTQWWSPTAVHVVGDASVAGLLVRKEDGTLETKFGDRIILTANHQIYADWIYLWWAAYTAKAHGGVYIVLKESLKNVPFVGWGMQYFKFIFLSRKWEKDEIPLKQSLTTINKDSDWPAWLLLFPEGTNITQNGVNKSHSYAQKFNFQEPRNLLLPRARGLYFMLKHVEVPYLYDCTIAYEGVPRGGFGEDYFTLSSIYIQGRPPKSVNMHFRRWARSTIPLDDESEFERWLQKRWQEKGELLESYYINGHFDGEEQVDTEIRLKSKFEILQLYAMPAALVLCANVLWKTWSFLS